MRPFLFLACLLAPAAAHAQIISSARKPAAFSAPTDVDVTLALFKGLEPRAYSVVKSYPHDSKAFTEGLLWRAGALYESTGLEGESEVRKVDLNSGAVLKSAAAPNRVFGEGLTLAGNRLIQLTYKDGRALVYDADTFEKIGEYRYFGEGWGLAFDGRDLIMSDGSDTLTFRDPDTFQAGRRVQATVNGKPLADINELEFIDGKIWANIWLTNIIVAIDPATGIVTDYVDLTGLMGPDFKPDDENDVLNGIAYDPGSGHLFVTGKRWPRLFEIQLKP